MRVFAIYSIFLLLYSSYDSSVTTGLPIATKNPIRGKRESFSEAELLRMNTTIQIITASTAEQLSSQSEKQQQHQELHEYSNESSNVIITIMRALSIEHLTRVSCQSQKTREDCLAGKEKKRDVRLRDSPCEWCCGGGCYYDYNSKYGSFAYGKNCVARATLYDGVDLKGRLFVNYSANGLGGDTCANYTTRYGTELFGLKGEIVAWAPGEGVQYNGVVGRNVYPDMLRSDNSKCSDIWNAEQCFTSRDGRTGSASGTLCQWCCGDSCDFNQPWDAKCETQQGIFSEAQAGVKYLGYSKNGLGYDTCRFKAPYADGYRFFDDHLQEGEHNHRTTLSQIYTVPEVWRAGGETMDFPEVEAYIVGNSSDFSNGESGNNTVKSYVFNKSLSYEMNLIEFSGVVMRDFAAVPALTATANVVTDEYIALRGATVDLFGEMWLESFTLTEVETPPRALRNMLEEQARQFGVLFDDYYRRLLFERKREELISDLFGPTRPEYAFDLREVNYTTVISLDEDDKPSELVYGIRYEYHGLKSVCMAEYRRWEYYNEGAERGVEKVAIPLGLYYMPGDDTGDPNAKNNFVHINPNYTVTSIEDFMNNCNPLGTVDQHYVPYWERGTGNETYSQRSLSTVRVRDVCRRHVLNTCSPEDPLDPLSRCLGSSSDILYVPMQFLTNFTRASNTSNEEYFVSLGFEMPNTTVNYWRKTTSTTSTTTTTTAPPLNCVGAWGDFTACSNGQQQRSFVVSQVAEVGGTACSPHSDGDLESTTCGIACVGNWTVYSVCNGTHEYSAYLIESPALDGGTECAYQNMTSRVRACATSTTTSSTTSTTSTTTSTISTTTSTTTSTTSSTKPNSTNSTEHVNTADRHNVTTTSTSAPTTFATTATLTSAITQTQFADGDSVVQVVEAVLMFSIHGSTTFEEFSAKTNSNNRGDEESNTPDDVIEAREALRKLLIAAFVESVQNFTDIGFTCAVPDCQIRVTHLEIANNITTSRRAIIISQRSLEQEQEQSTTIGHLEVEFEVVSSAKIARKARAAAEDANAMTDFASRAEHKIQTNPTLIEADGIFRSMAFPEVVAARAEEPILFLVSSSSTTTTTATNILLPGLSDSNTSQHSGVISSQHSQDSTTTRKPAHEGGVFDDDSSRFSARKSTSGSASSIAAGESNHCDNKERTNDSIDFIFFSLEKSPVKFSSDGRRNAVITHCVLGAVALFLLQAFVFCAVKLIRRWWSRKSSQSDSLLISPTSKEKLAEVRRGSKNLSLQGEETRAEAAGKMVSRVKSVFATNSIASRFSGIPESRYLTSVDSNDSLSEDCCRSRVNYDDHSDGASIYSATTLGTIPTMGANCPNNGNYYYDNGNYYSDFAVNDPVFRGSSEKDIVQKAQSMRNKMVQGSRLGLGINTSSTSITKSAAKDIGELCCAPVRAPGASRWRNNCSPEELLNTADEIKINTKNNASIESNTNSYRKKLDNCDELLTTTSHHFGDSSSDMGEVVVVYGADALVVGRPLEESTTTTTTTTIHNNGNSKSKALGSNNSISSNSKSDTNNDSTSKKKSLRFDPISADDGNSHSNDMASNMENNMDLVKIKSTAESRRLYEDYLGGKKSQIANYKNGNINSSSSTQNTTNSVSTNGIFSVVSKLYQNRHNESLGGVIYSTSSVVEDASSNINNNMRTNMGNMNDPSGKNSTNTTMNKQPSIVKKMTSRRRKRHEKKVYDTVSAEYPGHDEVDPDNHVVFLPADDSSSINKKKSTNSNTYNKRPLDTIIGRSTSSEELSTDPNSSSNFLENSKTRKKRTT